MSKRWMLRQLATMVGVLGAVVAVAGQTPAHAVLVDPASNISYTLTEFTTANPLINQFDLHISNINGPTDLEGGRSGVNAIAFTQPANFASAAMVSPPSGFVFQLGGLNSSGCSGNGNFYCFDNTAIPPTPSTAFAANSTLDFVFNVTLSSGSFAGYLPDFKIDWVGSQNNYSLVSLPLAPTPGGQCTTGPGCGGNQQVPEPASLVLLGSALAGLGILGRRRRRG